MDISGDMDDEGGIFLCLADSPPDSISLSLGPGASLDGNSSEQFWHERLEIKF